MLCNACIFLTLATSLPAFAQSQPTSTPVRVMSFNIRYATPSDKDNQWEKRKELFMDTIRSYGPDLLGMQEVLAAQGDFIQEKLPDYGYVGVGRDDGKRKGEFSPVMFKKSRFEMVAWGTYWLSDTPEKVGSKGWDAALPRIMTWVKLKEIPTGTNILVCNTHWDHQGKKARVESGKLMRKLIEAKRDGLPVIVTGDFNSNEDSEQYVAMTVGEGEGKGLKLMDTYREVHPKRLPDESTMSNFKGTKKGSRIDWILHSPEWKARGAAINYTQKDGRFPSDHYPVTAEVELKK